jgi:hypothetical protein
MIDIVQFQTRDGSVVSVEVEEEETLGVERVARGERMIAQAASTIEDALGSVKPLIETLLNDMKSLTSSPDSVTVEIGLKLSASLDTIIAKGTGEGNIKLTLSWKRT